MILICLFDWTFLSDCFGLPNGRAQAQRRGGGDATIIIAPLLAGYIPSAVQPLLPAAGVVERGWLWQERLYHRSALLVSRMISAA